MNRRVLAGVLLMLAGIFLFFNDGTDYGVGSIFAYFWPSMFVLPLSILFHWIYFSYGGKEQAGLLIPAGTLFIVAIVSQMAMLFDGWSYLWPGFILAPAVGLLEFYWFGGRNKWLLIPINILGGISLLFFVVFSIGQLFEQANNQPLIAIGLVIIGVFMLIGKRKSDSVHDGIR
ncbi:hypothetical protein [Marinicrinis sediminis]|uniref:DUF5668 domain-containing protein n=1 Tax=Marinicrinis sediminis TaxID=1652465 RepID=A0ABW5RE56_9BACL